MKRLLGRFSLVGNTILTVHFNANAATTITADIREIRGPVQVDGPPFFILTAGVLILVLAALLIRNRLRRDLDRSHSTTPTPPVQPRQAASRRLAQLAAEFRAGSCAGDRLILCLDEVLRGELVDRTGIPATRLTSAELLRDVGANSGDACRALLADLLPLVDQVKFARHSPNAVEIDQALSVAAGVLAALRPGQTA